MLISNPKIGDYVRTKEFGINMIKWFDNEEPILENGFTALQSSGYKLSSNIIDLIEVGDYVNGEKIIETSIDHCGRKILIYGYDNGDRQVAITIYKEDIKSIVTKEQFEAMEYKIER